MNPKTLEIECTGYSVMADWYETDNTNEIILSLIGWTSNRKRYNDILSAICKKTGKSALVFEYSGHGDSPFDVQTTRPAQHFLEVICVYDWLREKYPHASITVMGTSYGGFLAAQLTKYRSCANLVLRAPAIYPPEDFYTLNGELNNDDSRMAMDAYRRDKETYSNHPLLKRAVKYKGRTLVVVHENDELVPKQTTDAYIKALNADVYIAKGFPHSIYDQPREKIVEYQDAISDWLNK